MLVPNLTQYLWNVHSKQEKIVLVTGVFDLLHQEHINFLIQARKLGTVLLVGLESDQRVKKLKGVGRPIHPQPYRLQQILDTGLVDQAFILPTAFSQPRHHRQLISLIRPHFLAVSSHTPNLPQKSQILAQFGGKVSIVYQHNPPFSSTQMIQNQQPLPTHLHPIFQSPTTKGFGRGRLLRFPTLNLITPSHFPYIYGVYGGWVYLKKQAFLGAFHYGPVPTFTQTTPSLEAFLLNTHLTTHPDRIKLEFSFRLRSIKSFLSPKALTQQISKDVATISFRLRKPNAKHDKSE